MVLGLIVAFINLRACDLLKSSILLRITRLFQVFALILEQQQGEASSDSYLISKFNLVDLAGSERAKRTKASGKLDSLHSFKCSQGFGPVWPWVDLAMPTV